LQVFDPHRLSRLGAAKARLLLEQVRIARPFTLFQLRDKLFSLTKMRLNPRSTVIVSGLDCFDSTCNTDEQNAVMNTLVTVLMKLQQRSGCRLVIGMRSCLLSSFRGAEVWEEQCCL